ncbi:MAG: pitrilysin family protein [candidate division WOR-3 bacterium]|nr:pitrilysin family protein [candidate division WOR-3 bacterium]
MSELRIKAIIAVFLLFSVSLAGIKLEDPRKMEFPARVEVTPPQVQCCTLSNGIGVFMLEDHEVPLLDIIFSIRAGETRVLGDQAGLAEILAEPATDGGSIKVPAEVFKDSLLRLGASFTYPANISGLAKIDFTLHLLSEHVEDLLPMVVDVIREPALPDHKLELIKNQKITAYQTRNQSLLTATSRIGSHLLIGRESPTGRDITPATLDRINRNALAEFHESCYRPSLTTIGVVGDFDPEAMINRLERFLGDWQEPLIEPWDEALRFGEPAPPGVYLVPWPGSVQSCIVIGHDGLARNDPCYPESRLFQAIYGTSWFSRLFKEVRMERGLAYLIFGNLSSCIEEPGSFYTLCLTRPDATLEATRLMLEIIEALRTEGVTQEELELAKSSFLNSFPKYYTDPVKVLQERMDYVKHDYPVDFWEQLPERIERLTREDVNRFAREFLKPDSLIIVVGGDSTAFDGSLSELGEVQIIDPEVY